MLLAIAFKIRSSRGIMPPSMREKRSLNAICVFCGSSPGRRGEYGEKARELGRVLASRGITLVFGGGDVGLMGELSRAALEAGGRAVGVIPQRILDMVGEAHVEEIIVARDMHERKARMYELSDGFIAMPGGIGTMEELFEIFTWYQLGYHLKPIGLLDLAGYFSAMERFLEHMVAEGFFKRSHREALLVETEPSVLVDRMCSQDVVYHEKLEEP